MDKLEDAIAGSVDLLSSSLVALFVEPEGAPTFGEERSRRVAELWAPVLAPYVAQSQARWVVWAVLVAATLGPFAAYLRELSAWRKLHPAPLDKGAK